MRQAPTFRLLKGNGELPGRVGHDEMIANEGYNHIFGQSNFCNEKYVMAGHEFTIARSTFKF